MKVPIAIFVFNRPEHTLATLQSLSKNSEFSESPLYFFCDGPRGPEDDIKVQATRAVAYEFKHPNKKIIEAPVNKGLSKSIIDGVSYILRESEAIIVIEDDLLVSPNFLNYMNCSLKRYALEDRVMQVSGHMFKIHCRNPQGSVFLPFTTSWGWGTWRRAWNFMAEDKAAALEKLKSRSWRLSFDMDGAYPNSKMLSNRISSKNNSWAIWFYYNVYIRSGLVLFPQVSLVNNAGFDGSGTHCKQSKVETIEFQCLPVSEFPSRVEIDNEICRDVKLAIARQRGVLRLLADNIWRLFGKGARL